MSVEHPRDDLAAYALGAVEPAERADLAAHLERCATCRAEVAAHGETLFAIASTAARRTPPGLRGRIVSRERRGGWVEGLLALLRRPLPAALPAALAVLLVIALANVGSARREADAYAQALTGAAGGRVVALAPAGDPPPAAARGALVIPKEGMPYLLLELPPPPTGKTYQAWIVKSDRPIPAGRGQGVGVFAIRLCCVSPEGGDTVAVTVEDAAGADVPTTKPLLLAKT